MFEFVRNHKKWMQLLLALIIAPMFIIGGVGLTNNGDASSEEVANVGGMKVTQQEWDEAQRQAVDRARATEGERFDAKRFETPEAKKDILNNLVALKAIDAEIAKSHLTVGDDAVMREIAKIGAFQKPDGSFSMENYKAVLKLQGMAPLRFQEQIRRDLTLQQINNSITGTAFAPRTVATRLSEYGDQEREVQEVMFPLTDFLPQVQVTPEMVKAYYDKNATLFQLPETIKAEYVVLDASVVEKLVTVDDADVAKFYADNKDKFKTPEQRKASHILLTVKAGDAAQKATAKQQADAVLAEVRATPAKFAELAKTRSQDVASAELGGDLGLVSKDSVDGQLFGPLQKLKQGEFTVVETGFGYHVVTITSLVPETFKTLEEAKPMIMAELRNQKMSKKYSELAETFNNTVDEQNESLKPAADKLGLTVQIADRLTRTPLPALGESPVNNAKFLTPLFSANAIKTRRNIEAVEVAPSVLVAGRVVEHRPASLRPLAEVELSIRDIVLKQEAGKLAKKAGDAKIAAAKAAGDAAGFGAAKVVTRSQAAGIAPAAAEAVLKADVATLPAYVGVTVPGAGYGVYRIGKVGQPAQIDPARRKADQDAIGSLIAQQEMASYIEALKVKAKSVIKAKTATVADAR